MAGAKTKPTAASVDKHLAAVATDAQRADAHSLIALMRRVTREEPKMWGPSIIGFGTYHYRYESGREGDAALAGFAIRKSDLTVYITAGFDGQEALLATLGKHKVSKACLYIKRLSDIDFDVLTELVTESVAAMESKRVRA